MLKLSARPPGSGQKPSAKSAETKKDGPAPKKHVVPKKAGPETKTRQKDEHAEKPPVLIPADHKLILSAQGPFPHDPESAEGKALLESLSEHDLRHRYCYHLLGPSSSPKSGDMPLVWFYWQIPDKKKGGHVFKPIPKQQLRYFHKKFSPRYKEFAPDPYRIVPDDAPDGAGFLYDSRYIEWKSVKTMNDSKKGSNRKRSGAAADGPSPAGSPVKKKAQKTDSPRAVNYPNWDMDTEHKHPVPPVRDTSWSVVLAIANAFPLDNIFRSDRADSAGDLTQMFVNQDQCGAWKHIIRNPIAPIKDAPNSSDSTDSAPAPESKARKKLQVEAPARVAKRIDISPLWLSMHEERMKLADLGKCASPFLDVKAGETFGDTRFSPAPSERDIEVAACLYRVLFAQDKHDNDGSGLDVPSSPRRNSEENDKGEELWYTIVHDGRIHRWKMGHHLRMPGGIHSQKTLERQEIDINAAPLARAVEHWKAANDTEYAVSEVAWKNCSLYDLSHGSFPNGGKATPGVKYGVHPQRRLMMALFNHWFPLAFLQTHED